MLRFAKPDGNSFDLDYTGDICVFDSGEDMIAICHKNKDKETNNFDTWGNPVEDDFPDPDDCISDPQRRDDWDIVIDVPDNMKSILQRAIAAAWSSTSLVERMLIEMFPREDVKKNT